MSRGWLLTAAICVVVTAAYCLLSVVYETPTEEVQKAWTCLGLIGAIVTAANLIDSWIDLSVLKQSGRNGDLRLLARAGIRQDGLRLVQMLTVSSIGLVSLSAAPLLTEEQRARLNLPTWTPTSIFITTGIVLIVAITVLQAILDRRARLAFYSKQGVRRPSMKERRDAEGGAP